MARSGECTDSWGQPHPYAEMAGAKRRLSLAPHWTLDREGNRDEGGQTGE